VKQSSGLWITLLAGPSEQLQEWVSSARLETPDSGTQVRVEHTRERVWEGHHFCYFGEGCLKIPPSFYKGKRAVDTRLRSQASTVEHAGHGAGAQSLIPRGKTAHRCQD